MYISGPTREDCMSRCVCPVPGSHDSWQSELCFEPASATATLTLYASEDLRQHIGYFPREVVPEYWCFVLTSNRSRMNDAIAESRRDEVRTGCAGTTSCVCTRWALG